MTDEQKKTTALGWLSIYNQADYFERRDLVALYDAAARALLQAPPAVEAEGVKVRVAVAVWPDGRRYGRVAFKDEPDAEMLDRLSSACGGGIPQIHILTATVPLPTIETIPARIETAGAA